MTNTQLGASVVLGACAILGAIAFFGLSPFGKQMVKEVVTGATPTGTTFNTAKLASVTMVPGNTATSSSVLNPAGQDVYVTGNFVTCSNATTTYTAVTGAGLANWTVKAATTSTASPAIVSNTNVVMNTTVATGTTAAGTAGFGNIEISSSTAPILGNGGQSFVYLWGAGSYMTFFFNATSTANCTVGVNYISS